MVAASVLQMKLTLEVEIKEKSIYVKHYAPDNGDYLGGIGTFGNDKDGRRTSIYLGGGEFLKLIVSSR